MKTLTVTDLECFQESVGNSVMWVITTKEPDLCAQGRTIAEVFAAFGNTLQTHVYLLDTQPTRGLKDEK